MKTITYRSTKIVTDGACFYVPTTTDNRGTKVITTEVVTEVDEYPFDTLTEARAFIDNVRLERTLNAMSREWYS